MKQLSFIPLGLITMLLVGCQPTKSIVIPAGWQSYQIDQDTAIATFALPPDFKEVEDSYFYYSSELFPGQKAFFFYDRGFKSNDFELSGALNALRESGLSYIKAANNRRKEYPYKKKKIAGREFWVRGLWTTSAESMRYIMLYYLDYLDAEGNHLHIDIYCYETKQNKRKAKQLIKSIAKTMDIQVVEKKKQPE